MSGAPDPSCAPNRSSQCTDTRHRLNSSVSRNMQANRRLVPAAPRDDRAQSLHLLRRLRLGPLFRRAQDDVAAERHDHPAEPHHRRRRRLGARQSAMLLRLPVNAFMVVFRNTPPLVQLYFFYFGARHLLRSVDRRRACACRSSATSPGRSSRCRSSPARSTSRSSAPASRRCRATTIEAAESARLHAAARPTLRRPAAGVPHQPAGAQQQSRQPGQDDDARLRDRRAGDALRGQARSGRTSSTCRR